MLDLWQLVLVTPMNVGEVGHQVSHIGGLSDSRVNRLMMRLAELFRDATDQRYPPVPSLRRGDFFDSSCNVRRACHVLATSLEARRRSGGEFRVNFSDEPPASELFCSQSRGASPSEWIDDHLTRLGQELNKERR